MRASTVSGILFPSAATAVDTCCASPLSELLGATREAPPASATTLLDILIVCLVRSILLHMYEADLI